MSIRHGSAWACSRRGILCVILLSAVLQWVCGSQARAENLTPSAVASFHTVSLYWSRAKAGTVDVQYRRSGASAWKAAQPLWYDSVNANATYRDQYRGSIVNLDPDTVYNVQYRLAGADWVSMGDVRTRAETFTGRVVSYAGKTITKPLEILEGGSSATDWVIYDGGGTAVIDVGHQGNCINVHANFVVIRGFTIRDCGGSGVVVDWTTTGKRQVIHDVVVENNLIEDWGLREIDAPIQKNSSGAYLSSSQIACAGMTKGDIGRINDAAVYAAGRSGIVVQRNTIRNPRYRATRWMECPAFWNGHPYGPRAIVMIGTVASPNSGNVIRYNEIFATNTKNGVVKLSDDANRYYDILGVAGNRDMDIYGNILRNCTDDAIEADETAMNVRIWGNYIDSHLMPVSFQHMDAGPAYIFRNIIDRGADMGTGHPQTYNVSSTKNYDSGNLLKLAEKNGGSLIGFNGPIYFYHNTSLRAGPDGADIVFLMYSGGFPYDMKNIVSENNIWMTAKHYIYDEVATNMVNSYFNDMHNQGSKVTPAYAYRFGPQDLQLAVVWKPGNGPGATWTAPDVPTGRYQPANAGTGAAIANFNDPASQGRGAQPASAGNDDRMRFGVKADWTYRPSE